MKFQRELSGEPNARYNVQKTQKMGILLSRRPTLSFTRLPMITHLPHSTEKFHIVVSSPTAQNLWGVSIVRAWTSRS